MRVAIHTLGTRGDIQPYLGLALGLKQLGHDVLIAAPSQYESFIGSRGIAFAHLPGEFLDLMDSPEAKAAMGGGGGFAAGFKMIKKFKPIGRRQLAAEWAAARQFRPELLIYHPKAIGALHVAEKLSVRAVLASPLPGFTPTREFASPMVPFGSVGPFNKLSHSVMANGGESIFRKMIGEWRVSELELAPRPATRLRPVATLYAYSTSVLPRPSDWPESVAVTGYWFLDDNRDWRPEPALRAFLDAGEPPIYVGFGSMPALAPAELTSIVIEALGLAGKRAVLATGGGAIHDQPATTQAHFIEGAPHDRLFPLMAACIHHGGAGTTGASLRAGKPTVICPFFGDQPFWARRLHELEVGPAPREMKKLNAAWLADAMTKVTTNQRFAENAARIGGELRSEQGVADAIAFLQRRKLLT